MEANGRLEDCVKQTYKSKDTFQMDEICHMILTQLYIDWRLWRVLSDRALHQLNENPK